MLARKLCGGIRPYQLLIDYQRKDLGALTLAHAVPLNAIGALKGIEYSWQRLLGFAEVVVKSGALAPIGPSSLAAVACPIINGRLSVPYQWTRRS